MRGPDDATRAVDSEETGLSGPPLEETLLGDPADLHQTEVVGAAKASAKASAKANRAPAWMLNAVVATGDLLITVALASSLFFSLQPNEARSKVALYLAVTMVPFVILAPVIGPLLDRLRGGRRFAMATTALIRALLALVLAKTIASGSLAVYPAAFGCLAASRAYGVSRSAVIPRVLPSGTSLVRANSRINLFTLFATLAATPIGYGLGKVNEALPLLLAALVFFAGTALAMRLPKHVDSDEGELKGTWRCTSPSCCARTRSAA